MALRRRPIRRLLKLISPQLRLRHTRRLGNDPASASGSMKTQKLCLRVLMSAYAPPQEATPGSQVSQGCEAPHQQWGRDAVSPKRLSVWTALMASLSVAILTKFIVVCTPPRSRQLLAGTKKAVAPAFWAAEIFS
jgi:hypothetical protein